MVFQKAVLLIAILGVTNLSAVASSKDSDDHKEKYSPYANSTQPANVYWGDSHLHTGLSLDAGLFGNTLGPDDAYEFARGGTVISSTGIPVKLARPLDWMVLTDHTDLMGLATGIQTGSPNVLADKQGKGWSEAFQKGGQAAGDAALDLIRNFSQLTMSQQLVDDYSPGSKVFGEVWKSIVEAAEKNNEPGLFTAFIGYE